ncbi:CHAT domain-containing protein [Protaetiibacter intestinalis]|uniref:CHAT domain-containing protein n=1 Tax=Protaetiibacter intestinalis TaxID=2419774 RepID=A0A387BHU1_9MICO|nr:CHAT domain-containing protein [Protaetiibacter intestinalis]AYF98110.1 CHAT domain-containing protein [Protaetiibacter intestinalis]
MAVRLTPAELYARAVVSGNAGRHASARRDLERALARDPDADTAALVSGSLAYLDSERGSPDVAIAGIDRALEAEGISPQTRAVLVGQRGLLELRRGRGDAAIRDLSDAIDELHEVPLSLGRVLLNRGLVRLDRAEVDAAERDFAAAAEAFARAGETVEEAKAHSNAGYAAMLRGDLAEAIRTMDAAAQVLGALSPVMQAVCDGDRAEALLAAGMAADAVPLLQEAARIYGARRLRQTQAEAELLLARALLLDRPAEAASTALRAARRFRARGSQSWATRADAVVATGQLRAGAASAETRRRAREAAHELDALHRPEDAALLRLELALAEVAAGQLAAATATRASAPAEADASIAVQLRTAEVDAELAQARGDAEAVLTAAAQGIETLTTWQSSLGSLELNAGAAVHGHRLAVLGIRAALADGAPQRVLDWSERVRTMSGSFVPLRPPADDRVAAALVELRELRRLEVVTPEAAAREARLRDEVRRIHWADAARGAGPGGTVALAELHAALAADDAAFVAHLWVGDRFAALVVAPGAAPEGRIVDLGPASRVQQLLAGLLADLDVAAAELPAAFRASTDAALAARLAALDELLLAPFAHELARTSRLVLTPAGALAGIPWPLLPGADGRPLVVAESAARWLALRGAPGAVGTAGFASGPGVARADAELDASAASWAPDARVVRHEADAAEVTEVASRVELLHIAAHGRHSAEHPLFSGFELADGPWFGYDIDQLARVPAVVIMSACELGRSSSRWGLEALGMARAWLHAGTRSVVASPAAVADVAASEVLPAVHRELARGAGVADALSAATSATGFRTPLLVRGAGW